MAKSRAKKKVAPAETTVVPTKTKIAAFKITPEQYTMIEERAARRGMRVGPWMRGVVLQAANAPTNGRFIRVYEPSGATS